MDIFEDDKRSSEIWGADSVAPKNVTVTMDMKSKQINIISNDKDDKGRSIQEYSLNTQSGKVQETKRSKDGSEVQITNKQVPVAQLDKDKTAKVVAKQAEESKTWLDKLETKKESIKVADN